MHGETVKFVTWVVCRLFK